MPRKVADYFIQLLDRQDGRLIGAAPLPGGTPHFKANLAPLSYVISHVDPVDPAPAVQVASYLARAFKANVYGRPEGGGSWELLVHGRLPDAPFGVGDLVRFNGQAGPAGRVQSAERRDGGWMVEISGWSGLFAAHLLVLVEATSGRSPLALPSFEGAAAAVERGCATPLEQFIYDHTPAGTGDETNFRDGLERLLRWAGDRR